VTLWKNHTFTVIVFCTRQQLSKLDFHLLAEKYPSITFLSSVRDLCVVLDSTLTFSEHIASLTRFSYFHLRRLRAIRRSVSSSVFTSIIHAFICSRIDYRNSLLVGLPKVRLSPLQPVLNAAASLIARFPPWSHISSFMFDHLHWLPLIARIQLKVLTLIHRSYSGLAPKYLRDLIRLPISATSLRPLHSLDRHDLLVPRSRTAMAKTRAFAFVGPALWNQLSPSTCSVLLTGGRSTSFHCLKTAFFSLGLSHWERL